MAPLYKIKLLLRCWWDTEADVLARFTSVWHRHNVGISVSPH